MLLAGARARACFQLRFQEVIWALRLRPLGNLSHALFLDLPRGLRRRRCRCRALRPDVDTFCLSMLNCCNIRCNGKLLCRMHSWRNCKHPIAALAWPGQGVVWLLPCLRSHRVGRLLLAGQSEPHTALLVRRGSGLCHSSFLPITMSVVRGVQLLGCSSRPRPASLTLRLSQRG